ncbi:TPA: hypothetical protein ACH3X3_009946 [Trebouxia sp. C0006]
MAEQTEGLKVLTDSLRSKHGLDWRNGIVEDRRFEFFRGKDFAVYFKEHPEKFDSWIPDKTVVLPGDADAQIKTLIELLLRRRLIFRTDRLYKKAKPGKKRLAKWPKKLLPVRDRDLQTFSEEGFYAWAYDRPASPYLWMFSVLIAVVVVGACMFPLAPYKVKLVVVYLSMGLLMTLMGALLLRGAVAGATWMAFGRSFWLLPNVLSEEVGFKEAFWPLYEMDDAEPITLTNIALRASFALLAAGVSWLLYANSPDKGQVGDGARKARDSILDMLNLHDPAQLKLGNESGNQTNKGSASSRIRPDLQDINYRM